MGLLGPQVLLDLPGRNYPNSQECMFFSRKGLCEFGVFSVEGRENTLNSEKYPILANRLQIRHLLVWLAWVGIKIVITCFGQSDAEASGDDRVFPATQEVAENARHTRQTKV